MRRSSRSFKGYTSVFVLMLFVFIISTCVAYSTDLIKQLSTIENLKEVKKDIADEYKVLITFDCLLKNYEPEPIYDEEGNEIENEDPEIIVEDFDADGIYVDVTNAGDFFLLHYDDAAFKVYGDLEGIKAYEYH